MNSRTTAQNRRKYRRGIAKPVDEKARRARAKRRIPLPMNEDHP